MNRLEQTGAGFLIVLSLLVATIFTLVSTSRPLTNLEGMLLQGFSLIAGLLGSFLFGRISARSAARDLIKPHARSAFRRLLSLYRSLSRAATTITGVASGSQEEQKVALAQLKAIVVEQLATADDALADWHDIVPEDVDELREQLTKEPRIEVPR